MKIFTSTQIKELDKYTIENEPIKSIDLMERAARALTIAIIDECTTATPVVVFAGPGNNGGDALAVARMLAERGYNVSAYLFNINNKLSEDCQENKQRAMDCKRLKSFIEVTKEFDPPQLTSSTLLVDGLFGTGLVKPLEGGFPSLVKYINQSPCRVVSIDMPSGLMAECNTYNIHGNIVRADVTLTLQTKKLAFLFADIQQYIGRLKVLDIRLSKEYMEKAVNSYEELKVWLKDHQIPYVLVHSVAWQNALGLRAQESHRERKERLWNKAKELFPRIKIQSWNVTPLLLTTFGEYMVENNLEWILSNLPKDIKIAERE